MPAGGASPRSDASGAPGAAEATSDELAIETLVIAHEGLEVDTW